MILSSGGQNKPEELNFYPNRVPGYFSCLLFAIKLGHFKVNAFGSYVINTQA